MTRILLIPAAFLSLTACMSFGGKAPSTLLTLTPEASGPESPTPTSGASVEASGGMIAILPPTAPVPLATDRVVVSTGPNSMAYLADVRWADQPARLFADLLGEAITRDTGRAVIDRRQSALTPATRLGGRLSAFGLDATKDEVVVQYDAVLMPERTGSDAASIRTRRFVVRLATPSQRPAAVGVTLNRAANQVASDVAAWVGR